MEVNTYECDDESNVNALEVEKFGKGGRDTSICGTTANENISLKAEEFSRASSSSDISVFGTAAGCMVETIEMTCGSFDESIRQAEVNVMEIGIAQENRGSNVHVEQGRESCIA